MDITTMTKEELSTLKNDITKELRARVRKDYDELENKLIKLITDFEEKTGHYVVIDDYEGTDYATNFIKAMFFYTDEYIDTPREQNKERTNRPLFIAHKFSYV